jgi:hypothetical protein
MRGCLFDRDENWLHMLEPKHNDDELLDTDVEDSDHDESRRRHMRGIDETDVIAQTTNYCDNDEMTRMVVVCRVVCLLAQSFADDCDASSGMRTSNDRLSPNRQDLSLMLVRHKVVAAVEARIRIQIEPLEGPIQIDHDVPHLVLCSGKRFRHRSHGNDFRAHTRRRC